jgi:precorrin-8X/cobalt-precorrin-8 methylmutase
MALFDAHMLDPAEIYRRSFAVIRREADLDRFQGAALDVAIRVIHACGMPEIAADLTFSEGAAEAGRGALAAGKPLLVDVHMVAHGIIRSRLPASNRVVCALDAARVAALAEAGRTTRSAAAVRLWGPEVDGAVAVFGNAPTALFQLLDLVAAGGPRPAVVLGFPVGFIGAAESKEALVASGLPHICLRGRRGGSAMAAAAVNALARGER